MTGLNRVRISIDIREVLPQVRGLTGFERASWFFYNPVPPELAARCLSA